MPFRNARAPRCHGPRVLTGYSLQGYETVFLENELLRVAILAGRGSSIPEFLYKPADLDVMLKNFGGLRPHSSFTLSDHDVPPFADYRPEAWFECFPSGSRPSLYAGARVGFHGEIWGLPFEINSFAENNRHCAVTMTAYTLRLPWKLVKTFSLRQNDPTLYLEETATNLSHQELSVMWGQHPFFGAPFLDEHCRVEIPGEIFFEPAPDTGAPPPPPGTPLPPFVPAGPLHWPHNSAGTDLSYVRSPQSGAKKMAFVTALREGCYRLHSPTWKLAFELRWNKADFPWCWYYENAGGADYPGWGQDYSVALEPFTGLPQALENNEGVLTIPAQGSKTVQFEARIVTE